MKLIDVVSKHGGIPSILFLASLTVASVSMAETRPVDLGAAGNYVILAKSGITSTGNTSITGNIGVYPIAATAVTGFGLILDRSKEYSTSSLVNGKVYAANYASPTPANLLTAVRDMESAYSDAAGRPAGVTELDGGLIGGKTLSANVYKWSGNVLITRDLFLSGNSRAVWIFQIAGKLTLDSGVQVKLEGGADAKNVFWQVAGVTNLGTTAVLKGTVLDHTAVTMESGATLNGNALAQTDVTLIADTLK